MDIPQLPDQYNLDDEILEYLRKQENEYVEDVEFKQYEESIETSSIDTITDITNILYDILNVVETNIALKEVYDISQSQHNQRVLLTPGDFIPDFEMTDKMFDDMVFRENLIISKLKRKDLGTVHLEDTLAEEEYETEPVGALCLDVQSAPGYRPINRFEQCTEEFENEMQGKIEKIHDVVMNDDPMELENYEDFLRQEVEQYKTMLEDEKNYHNDKFLIHLSSQFEYKEQLGGSRITSWVDKDLHILEEKRMEYLHQPDGYIEKMLYVAMKNRHYEVKHRSIPDNILKRFRYHFLNTRQLIMEGSNFILMRYLALTRFTGTIELSTTYIDGSLCRNIYECCGPSSGIVNDTKLDVCKIYRTIIEKCGIVHKSCTLLTIQGQILKQDWDDCEYCLHVNPVVKVRNRKPEGNEDVITRKIWDTDMELLSKYLDTKTETALLIKAYMKDHPEVLDLISDYVQYILQMKPDDILEFTIDYFKYYKPININRIPTSKLDSDNDFFRV